MTQSTYSWCGSQLHLVLDDDLAANYNRAQSAFFEAQKLHMRKTGQQWTGVEPLFITWTEEEQAAYSNFAKLINTLIEVNGGSLAITEEEMTSDYLIKL